MKKQVWYEKDGRYREKNLSGNRIALDFVRKNIGKRKFNLTEFERGLGVDRKTAWSWLYSLRKGQFLNSKPIGARQMLDNRLYQLSKKGIKKLPRKKGMKKESEKEIVEVEKEVEVEKINKDRFIGEA